MSYEICVLGLGYIGLPTASVFATRGKRVLGVDVVPRVVETINRGDIHIQEPDLDILVRAAVQSGNLVASTQPQPARNFIIAVPTPFQWTADNPRAPDLSYVEAATRSLAEVVAPGNLVILESTSPVGTTEKVREWLLVNLLLEKGANLEEKGEDDEKPLIVAIAAGNNAIVRATAKFNDERVHKIVTGRNHETIEPNIREPDREPTIKGRSRIAPGHRQAHPS